MTTTTYAAPRPDSRHVKYKGVRMNAILKAHRRPDGSTDYFSLVAAAVQARKDVQALELVVDRGGVPRTTRERLTCLQQIDLDHREILDKHILGWARAIEEAREAYPRCQRAKLMIRAARSLSLWAPLEKGPR